MCIFALLHYILMLIDKACVGCIEIVYCGTQNDIAAFLSKINNKLYDNVVPANACFIPIRKAEFAI